MYGKPLTNPFKTVFSYMKMLEIRCDGDLLFSTPINQKPNNRSELIAMLAQIFNKSNNQVIDVETVDVLKDQQYEKI